MSLIPKRDRKGGGKKQKQKFVARPGAEAQKAREAEEAARRRRRSSMIWTTVFVVGVMGLAALGFAINVFNPAKYPSNANHATDNSGETPEPSSPENGEG